MSDREELNEQNKIFRTLMHFPGSSFSDLWDKKVESNKFNYYLKKLEKEGFIEKKDLKYYLTVKGKCFSLSVCGETGKEEKSPMVTLLLVIKKGEKFILYNRLKEPYYGYFGFPGAKIRKGEEILLSAKRELKEETNFDCDGKIVGIHNIKTINNNQLFQHMLQFVVLFENPTGELITESREGTYNWATEEEILSKKNIFPDISLVLKTIEEKKLSLKEINFIQNDEKFVRMETKELNVLV